MKKFMKKKIIKIISTYTYTEKPWPRPGQAMFDGFGLTWCLRKPKPPQARPKPGLSGQAGPEQH